MTSAFSKQAGDGVTSEAAPYFDVLPGHQEKLRAAVRRFTMSTEDSTALELGDSRANAL